MKFISLKKQNFTNQIGKILLKIRYNKYVLYSKNSVLKCCLDMWQGWERRFFPFDCFSFFHL